MNRIRSDFHQKSTGYKLIAVAICSTVMGYLIGSSFSSILTEKVEMIHLNKEDTDYSADYKSALPKCSLSNSERQLIPRSDFASSVVNIRSRDSSKIRITTNPRGTETLPPGIIETHSDFYLHRLHGNSGEDLVVKPKYLLALTVGYLQKDVINSLISKFSENFSFILFHYDGRTSEWNQFEWSKRAIHISARKQTKWWYAKRFLHPDIVAPYEYIFIWDEDLGVEHFTAEKYVKLVKKHGLEISQPGLEPNNLPWLMTKRREDAEIHKEVEERPGWCHDPHLPPCAGFVEIMAPVFSRESWRCVWHMIQNDLVHGWGLDLALRRCVEPPHEKIGVVDAQWIDHKVLPSLGNQGEALDGRAPWEGVRARCNFEWKEFERRMDVAEKDYLHTHHLQ